jgi:hypothetical protein
MPFGDAIPALNHIKLRSAARCQAPETRPVAAGFTRAVRLRCPYAERNIHHFVQYPKTDLWHVIFLNSDDAELKSNSTRRSAVFIRIFACAKIAECWCDLSIGSTMLLKY